jgi:hypothetical protein
MPVSRPHKLSKKSIRYLKAREANGEHLGFENLQNIIYTGELRKHSAPVAKRIAIRTAAQTAIRKGRTRGSHQNNGSIPVLRK